MCGCSNCNGLTLFSGTDGVGITSITDNNNGTFTILLSNGTTWTSGDLTGPTGNTGATGAAGTNGTNAFKVVKDFSSNTDGGVCIIRYEDLTSCGNIPSGCIIGESTPTYANLQVQVWIMLNDPTPSGIWSLADSSNTTIEINDSTGNITVTLTGGGVDVLVRIVVIA